MTEAISKPWALMAPITYSEAIVLAPIRPHFIGFSPPDFGTFQIVRIV